MFESVGAFLVVFRCCYLFTKNTPYSLVLGAGLGTLLAYFLKKLKSKEEHFSQALGFSLIRGGLAKQLDLPGNTYSNDYGNYRSKSSP